MVEAPFGTAVREMLRAEALSARLLPSEGVKHWLNVVGAVPRNAIPMVESPDARRVAEVGAASYLAAAYLATVSALEMHDRSNMDVPHDAQVLEREPEGSALYHRSSDNRR